MTKKEILQNQVDEIMDEFDFDKVHEVMEVLNWQWRDIGIPDKVEIRRSARKLMKQAIEKDSSTGCGGFQVTLRDGSDEDGPWTSINLCFAIEASLRDGETYDKE